MSSQNPTRQPVQKPVLLDPRGSARSASTSADSQKTPPQGEAPSQTVSTGAGAAVNFPLADLEDWRAPLEDSLDDLPTAVAQPAARRQRDVDVAVCQIARRNGRVLLALLDVWLSAVGSHSADDVGGEIYNTLKSSADLLLHIKYPPVAD